MLQFVHRQLAVRFGNGALAMHPWRFGPIEPWTFDRQGVDDHPTTPFPLGTSVVRLEPRSYGVANVPRGIVPHHRQGRFPRRRHAVRHPLQELRRHCTDRSPIHKPEGHALCIRP